MSALDVNHDGVIDASEIAQCGGGVEDARQERRRQIDHG